MEKNTSGKLKFISKETIFHFMNIFKDDFDSSDKKFIKLMQGYEDGHIDIYLSEDNEIVMQEK